MNGKDVNVERDGQNGKEQKLNIGWPFNTSS